METASEDEGSEVEGSEGGGSEGSEDIGRNKRVNKNMNKL